MLTLTLVLLRILRRLAIADGLLLRLEELHEVVWNFRHVGETSLVLCNCLCVLDESRAVYRVLWVVGVRVSDAVIREIAGSSSYTRGVDPYAGDLAIGKVPFWRDQWY